MFVSVDLFKWVRNGVSQEGDPFFHPVSIPLVSLLCFFELLVLRSSGLVLHNAVIIDTHISLSTERFNP